MWRFALLCSILTLTVACGDGPGAPTVNTDGLSLQEDGDPPPPPLDGDGSVSFSRSDVELTATVTQDVCVPPPVIALGIEGNYFQNKSENHARIHFTPVDPVGGTASGAGTIFERANPATDPLTERQDAAGTLVVMLGDVQVQIHLEDFAGVLGASLFDYERGDFFGAIAGGLVATVTACGEQLEYTGEINFAWDCFECKDNF